MKLHIYLPLSYQFQKSKKKKKLLSDQLSSKKDIISGKSLIHELGVARPIYLQFKDFMCNMKSHITYLYPPNSKNKNYYLIIKKIIYFWKIPDSRISSCQTHTYNLRIPNSRKVLGRYFF